MFPLISIHAKRFHLIHWVAASFAAGGIVFANASAATHAHIFDTQIRPPAVIYRYSMEHRKDGEVDEWNAKFIDENQKEYASEKTVVENGTLARYFLHQPAFAEDAEVKIEGGHVIFRYLKDGRVKEDWERVSGTVIAPPQIVSIAERMWEPIQAGKKVPVRLVVADRLETIGFRFQKGTSLNPQETIIQFVPSSFFVRQVVDPIELVFDTSSKKILRLRGRTFLKKKEGNNWKPLIAEFRFD